MSRLTLGMALALIALNLPAHSEDKPTTSVTDQKSMQVHHTEYSMPEGGLLFANDHLAGRTFIFDLRDPLSPKVAASFIDMGGFSHPHSFLRLPNGHVLASFQHMRHAGGEMHMGSSGGLVEIDDQGQVIRAASSADPAFPDALLMPYSLVVLPVAKGSFATLVIHERPNRIPVKG